MRKKEQNRKKKVQNIQNRGITLIALVITIIVLLILAGVTIATLTGNNGILTRTEEATEETNRKGAEEKVAVEVQGSYGADGKLDYALLEDNLNNIEGIEGVPSPITEDDFPLEVTVDGYTVTINENGSVTAGNGGTGGGEEILGKYYDKDTDITVGGKPVTIPGGATISGITSETNINNGLVIYITNGEEITNWETAKTKYDQFVWVPVEDAVAVDMNDDKTVNETDIDSMIAQGRYPMAIETGNGNYRGVLYKFEEDEEGILTISDRSYSPTSGYREPDEVNSDSSKGIPEGTLQGEFNTMVGRVSEKGGFWVGRYETTNMNSKDFTTKEGAVNIVEGTTNGINKVTWYKMYEGQKAYKSAVLTNSSTTSSMIWGSQWDQIMIWMKDVPSVFRNDTYTGKFYITNSVGMGNYGVADSDNYDDKNNPEPTGCYDVKNIYDLAGNILDWTLEADDTTSRVGRRR